MASRAAGRLSQLGEETNPTLLLSVLNKKSMYDLYGVVIAGMDLTAVPDPNTSPYNDLPARITVRAMASLVFRFGVLFLDYLFPAVISRLRPGPIPTEIRDPCRSRTEASKSAPVMLHVD